MQQAMPLTWKLDAARDGCHVRASWAGVRPRRVAVQYSKWVPAGQSVQAAKDDIARCAAKDLLDSTGGR